MCACHILNETQATQAPSGKAIAKVFTECARPISPLSADNGVHFRFRPASGATRLLDIETLIWMGWPLCVCVCHLWVNFDDHTATGRFRNSFFFSLALIWSPIPHKIPRDRLTVVNSLDLILNVMQVQQASCVITDQYCSCKVRNCAWRNPFT